MEQGYVAEKEIQVLYADTDMMGVIYHGSYIKWLELGRLQLIEDIGYDYLTMERAGYFAPVYNVDITYKKALKYGERAFIRTWVQKNSGVKTIYGFEIINGEREVCTEGTTTLIVAKKVDDTFRPVSLKKTFPEWFQKYEEIKVAER